MNHEHSPPSVRMGEGEAKPAKNPFNALSYFEEAPPSISVHHLRADAFICEDLEQQ